MKLRDTCFLLLVFCLLGMLSGCTPEPKMSAKDKDQFKGGPMPPEAAAGMAKRMQEAGKTASTPAK